MADLAEAEPRVGSPAGSSSVDAPAAAPAAASVPSFESYQVDDAGVSCWTSTRERRQKREGSLATPRTEG
ncbi:unnamed protein product [Vitrella brassicaformis CCMP3155]|uniref:Uncharacterized protein n=1 Tax=Vitrella brassicaformis (strain CCMP3155) TaxID=1169540 RepID=A0A0G4GFT7_VITBC|nr:unnamed protein product [Vitrella brassicaformis CCMP3155]|eukprot:CEM28173.1 unnamed protein product [Vitrella brassicaformis CCMP3155]